MKNKLMLAMLFGLMFISPVLIIASDITQPDPEELNVPEPTRAKDGDAGASGYLNTNGQNGQKGQKGKKGQDGGNGGTGGNSWWGPAGDGGDGGDVD